MRSGEGKSRKWRKLGMAKVGKANAGKMKVRKTNVGMSNAGKMKVRKTNVGKVIATKLKHTPNVERTNV